ncbi:MAG TPA: M14 family metallopeptidase, partial [Actinomycetales bacterium]|nr:M14 family metallopeptidase [Actinomycetales bacterium]
RLTKLGLDLTEHAGPDYVEAVLHNATDVATLVGAGFRYDVRIADLALLTAKNNKASKAYADSVTSSPLPSGQDSYRTLADYEGDMRRLAALHPDLVTRFALPHKTVEGRTVYGIEISAPGELRDARPAMLMMGLHHAREWPSGEHAIEFAFDLVKNYGKDDRISRLLNETRVIVVPVVNADGFDKSVRDGMLLDLRELDNGGTASILATPGNAYKRKNCRPLDGVASIPEGVCGTASAPGGYGMGVDLNRNYGGFWGGAGASAVPLDPTYRGAGPFSEPETQNIRELISGDQVTTLITNHTFSNLVLRPPGIASQGETPDEELYSSLGAAMAAQNGYTNQHSWQLYDTTGSTEDWSYYATGGLGFTFEIGDEFHPPFPAVVDQYLGAGQYAGKGNREAYLIALQSTADAARHSVVDVAKAPSGATLRLAKEFATPTSNGASFKDRLESSVTVPKKGALAWHVNPSTRPLVMERRQQVLAEEPTRSQTFTSSTPLLPTQSADVEFVVSETDQDALVVDLDWATPDDYDLEVYLRQADGSLKQVGSSGAFVGEKERVLVQDPQPGTYVLRAVNFASISPTWTMTAALYESKTVTDGTGLVENWTLTCERPDGTVLQRVPVVVDRGARAKVDLSTCRSKY